MIFKKRPGFRTTHNFYLPNTFYIVIGKLYHKQMFEKQLRHKYFCDNMNSEIEHLFEKRDWEVHRMDKETLQEELNELVDQLNEEQIKRLIQLIRGMIGKAV